MKLALLKLDQYLSRKMWRLSSRMRRYFALRCVRIGRDIDLLTFKFGNNQVTK